MANSKRYRQVVREKTFERDLRQLLETDVRGADEFIDGAVNFLSRDPARGFPLHEGSNIRMITTNPSAMHVSPLIIYYTFDDDTVYLLSIKPIPSIPGDSD